LLSFHKECFGVVFKLDFQLLFCKFSFPFTEVEFHQAFDFLLSYISGISLSKE